MHVHAVIDDLKNHRLTTDRRGDRAWLAMVDAVHSVEGVSEQSRPGVDRRESLVIVGRGVADGHRDSCCAQLLNRGQCAIEFGGNRNLSQRAVGRRQKVVDFGGCGIAENCGAVGAFERLVKERPFEVAAEHERVACCEFRDRREAVNETGVIAAHERDH